MYVCSYKFSNSQILTFLNHRQFDWVGKKIFSVLLHDVQNRIGTLGAKLGKVNIVRGKAKVDKNMNWGLPNLLPRFVNYFSVRRTRDAPFSLAAAKVRFPRWSIEKKYAHIGGNIKKFVKSHISQPRLPLGHVIWDISQILLPR